MLRPAQPNDTAFIQSVLNRPGNLDKLEGYDSAIIAQAIADEQTPVFLWQPAGTAAQGFAWLSRDGARIKLEEFGTARPGAGIGARFFDALQTQLAQDETLDLFWLYVAADNAGAIRFYERFGFTCGAVRPAAWHRRQGPVADALYMERPLRQPAKGPAK